MHLLSSIYMVYDTEGTFVPAAQPDKEVHPLEIGITPPTVTSRKRLRLEPEEDKAEDQIEVGRVNYSWGGSWRTRKSAFYNNVETSTCVGAKLSGCTAYWVPIRSAAAVPYTNS